MMSLSTLFFIAPAQALTKEQCSSLYPSVIGASSSFRVLEKSSVAIKWDDIIVLFTGAGKLRADAELAKQTQVDFIRIVRQYATALEDIGYSLQLCAR